jgi:polyisoprenoid-binding protein YceI
VTITAQSTYAVDKVHSSVVFKIKHLNTAYVYGRFNEFSGTFKFDQDILSSSSISLEIKTDSIDTNEEKRDQHLRSNDFFNAKRYPVITFTSKEIRKSGDDYTVIGDLTMHGITKKIEADFTVIGEGSDPWGGYRLGGEAVFEINRKEFGITYMPDGLSDDVTVMVSLVGVKK